MIIGRTQISLYRLILSLSDALDYICPEIADHQQRVAYIAVNTARRMGYRNSDLADIFLAAALHDIGMIHTEKRVQFLRDGDLAGVSWHGETGYELLCTNDLFARAARIIRYHHTRWDEFVNSDQETRIVPVASQIVHLADRVERMIDREGNILEQSREIVKRIELMAGVELHPGCVKAFCAVARTEAFWLDCVSERIYSHLLNVVDESCVDATDSTIQGIAEIFAHVVDAMSGWTAAHTAGVAATAVALSRQLNFSAREQTFMRTAGLLHDLGKLSVPPAILDKKGKLSGKDWVAIKGHSYYTYRILETVDFPQQITEWAALHHERIDGRGYPFHLKGKDLSLGSRIMAVADVFTALSEDRPYRKGIGCVRAIASLQRQVKGGALDGRVVDSLAGNFEVIDNFRRQEQERYFEKQERLRAVISRESVPVASGEPVLA